MFAVTVTSTFFAVAMVVPSDLLLIVIAFFTFVQGWMGRQKAIQRNQEWMVRLA